MGASRCERRGLGNPRSDGFSRLGKIPNSGKPEDHAEAGQMGWSRFNWVPVSVLLQKKLTLPNRLTPKLTIVGCRRMGKFELLQEQKERILGFVTLFRKRIERVGKLIVKLGQFLDAF